MAAFFPAVLSPASASRLGLYYGPNVSRQSNASPTSVWPVIRPGQHCCTLVKEFAYGKNNPSWD